MIVSAAAGGDLLIEAGDLLRQLGGIGSQRRELGTDRRLYCAKLRPETIELLGQRLSVLNNRLPLGRVGRIVRKLRPVIHKTGKLRVQALAAQGVEHGFNLAAVLLGGVGRLVIGDAGIKPGIEGLIDLPLNGREIDPGADVHAGGKLLVGRLRYDADLARIVGVADIGNIIAGDLERGLCGGQCRTSDVECSVE